MPAIKNNNFLSDNTNPNSPGLPVLAQSRKSRQGPYLKTQEPLPMVFVKMEAGATLNPDQQYFMMDGAIGSFQ